MSTNRRDFVKLGLAAGMAPLIIPAMRAAAADNSFAASSLPKSSSIKMLIDNSGAGKTWDGGIKHFNETNQLGVQASFDTTDYSTLLQKSLLLLFAGSPQYDVFPVNGEWTAALQNYMLPLDGFIEADGLDLTSLFGAGAEMSANGHVLGLPARNAPNVFAYRKDLYDAAGFSAPKTLEEWASQVPKLSQKNGDRFSVYGTSIAEGANAPHFSTVMLSYLYFPHGLRLLSEDLKGPDDSLTSDAAVAILSIMQKLAADSPNQLAWSYNDNITAWQQGTIATSSIYSARSQAIEDPKTSTVTGKVGYALSPGIPAGGEVAGLVGPHKPVYFGGPWFLAINAKTANPRAAWELIKFLAASEEGQRDLALNHNNQPTLLSVLRSPEYHKKDPAAEVALSIYEKYGWSTVAPVPKSSDVELAVHNQIQQLFSGKDPKQVAIGIHDDIGRALGA